MSGCSQLARPLLVSSRVARVAWGLILAGAVGASGELARAEDELRRQRRELDDQYHSRLAELADWADQQGLEREAEQVRDWARPRDPRKLYLVEFPRSGTGEADAAAAKPPEAARLPAHTQWAERWSQLKRQQAEVWFELARRAIRAREVSLAFELILATARENPDHEAARRMLGYVRFRDQWQTPFEVRRLRAGQVWSDRFGWLPASQLKRYEAGERFYNGRWISVTDDHRLHEDIRRGWQVETDHYRVTTNHSLEAGVALGQQLERLYRAWQQVFAGFYTSEAQLAQLLEGRGTQRGGTVRHQVIYFRSRDEYNNALRHTIVADIGMTTGLYLNDTRQAYFFASDGPHDLSTLYHEATHQLFSESRPGVPIPGEKANFWIVEGIACYMESLRLGRHADGTGFSTLGGAEAVRFQDARYRLLESQFYVPLVRLAAASAAEIQRDPEIAKLYSQSAGLAHFLMHDGGGRYRDALVRYLIAVYSGTDQPGTLARLAATPFEQLDGQYRQFVVAADPASTNSADPDSADPAGEPSPTPSVEPNAAPSAELGAEPSAASGSEPGAAAGEGSSAP